VSEDWSDDELRASVVAYRNMQALERAGEQRFKRQAYRDLADKFGRTAKAFEFRMQNISAVLALLGREWLPGLKPAAHVGANVAVKLERLINEMDNVIASPRVEFEVAVREQVRRKAIEPPSGQATPSKTTTAVTSFVRDPAVKAWVLRRAKGNCECCNSPAPFVMPDGTPFLEVHHLRTLADGGSDRVSNAVAACPNCHRQMHHGKLASDMRASVLAKINELQHE
jgi:5-methylcytosine-specific restriction enzyme A